MFTGRPPLVGDSAVVQRCEHHSIAHVAAEDRRAKSAISHTNLRLDLYGLRCSESGRLHSGDVSLVPPAVPIAWRDEVHLRSIARTELRRPPILDYDDQVHQ